MKAAPKIPKNGLLSGMILTAISAVTVIAVVFIFPEIHQRFDVPLSPSLRFLFLMSALLMVVHKAESYIFGEYDQCPVYLTTGNSPSAKNVRQAIFLSFVPTFLGMLFMVYFALVGPPWHLMIIAIWLGQGLHEFHHLAKSLSRKKTYPGLYSSLLFIGTLSFGVFPLFYDSLSTTRGSLFYAYYLLLPVVFFGFYREDRSWTARTPREIWSGANQ
jgi:hypothetical protein